MIAETKEFISKGRLDALTDGVFAFAMTLLVVNLDLPEDFHPTSAAELMSALLGLGDTFIAYVVTFLVLASFWLARARTKEEPEAASGARKSLASRIKRQHSCADSFRTQILDTIRQLRRLMHNPAVFQRVL